MISAEEEVGILISTQNPDLLAIVDHLQAIDDEVEALRYLFEHEDEVFPERSTSGLVRFGIDLDDQEIAKLRKLYGNLRPDFVIIDEGKRPDWGGGTLLPVGLGLLVWQFWPKRRETIRVPQAPPGPLARIPKVRRGTLPPPPPPVAPAATHALDCPHCDQAVEVTSAHSGTVVSCPHCGGEFQVPVLS